MSKGVVLSVLASVLFAVMYYFTSLLTPLSGLEIFGWRMLLTMPCMTVFMLVSGEWRRGMGRAADAGGQAATDWRHRGVLGRCSARNCGCSCGRR